MELLLSTHKPLLSPSPWLRTLLAQLLKVKTFRGLSQHPHPSYLLIYSTHDYFFKAPSACQEMFQRLEGRTMPETTSVCSKN